MKSRLKVVKEDLTDDIFVWTAFDGKADYIVSGDKHLFNLKDFKGVKILTIDKMLRVTKC